MGNACTNCSACKGDMGENSEVLTVDNKVSQSLRQAVRLTKLFVQYGTKMSEDRLVSSWYPNMGHQGIQINWRDHGFLSNELFLQVHFQKHTYLVIRLQAWARGVVTRE